MVASWGVGVPAGDGGGCAAVDGWCALADLAGRADHSDLLGRGLLVNGRQVMAVGYWRMLMVAGAVCALVNVVFALVEPYDRVHAALGWLGIGMLLFRDALQGGR